MRSLKISFEKQSWYHSTSTYRSGEMNELYVNRLYIHRPKGVQSYRDHFKPLQTVSHLVKNESTWYNLSQLMGHDLVSHSYLRISQLLRCTLKLMSGFQILPKGVLSDLESDPIMIYGYLEKLRAICAFQNLTYPRI